MRLNWGTGIALVALAFVCFMLDLVYRCANEKVDLVSESYYENELRFQERIDRQHNAHADKARFTIIAFPDSVQLCFKGTDNPELAAGEIQFFRPDESGSDFMVPLVLGRTMTQVVKTAGKKSGKWIVKVEWSFGRSPYYQEEEIWMQ
jgi:hypothetical protein